jgi:uncharacterized protein (DUF58 family)
MNNKTLVVGLFIVGLLVIALSTRNGDIAWMILFFLAYLLVGIWQSPPLERLSFSAGRKLEQSRSNGIASVEMRLSVQNKAAQAVHLLVDDNIQPGMKIIDGELSRRVTLQPGEMAEMVYTFTAIRGNFLWQSIPVLVSDPLDLIQARLLLPAKAATQIQPAFKKFKSIPLRPHSTLHVPGSIPAKLGGSGTDFFGVREYHAGDPLRSLDWRLTARHPRRFFTKEFEQKEIADIGLILDARQSAELRIGEESLFEHSVGATASLAEMFLHQGHRVSLLVYGRTMLNVFPGYGKMQRQRVMSCLSKATVDSDKQTTVPLNYLPIRMFPSKALIILVSSHTAADRPLFVRLRAYGYQVLLVSPDPIDFARPTLGHDATSQLAILAGRLERRLQLKNISQLQIRVIDWQVSQPLFPLVRNALTRSRGQQR